TQRLTLGEWLDKWLTLYKVGQVKDSTLYKQKQYIKQLAELHKLKLTDITAMTLQQFLMSIDKPRKRELLYVVLSDALQRAADNGLIANNPCKLVKIPKNKRTPKKALTQAEEQRIVNACMEDKFGVMFLFCLYEGLRIGEVKALTENDIDYVNGTISITKAINDFNKVDSPKSETSKRVIPLFARMKQALRVKPFQKITGDNHIYEHWSSICEQANVQCNVHSLRHTFATRCAEASISPKLTQQWLGHSTIQVTMDVYTHINAEFEAREVAKFDTHFDTHADNFFAKRQEKPPQIGAETLPKQRK
ncbi:MAG: site-specific integrase, partial [Corallococcus sp.]|nr:site-specific integrase [Corallococcus sp.]